MFGRPKDDFRLSFWFSAAQLTRVCLASYTVNILAEGMEVARRNGNVHSWTSHAMMMMRKEGEGAAHAVKRD